MSKTFCFFMLVLFFSTTFAQSKKDFLPFVYNGKIGIVDANQKEVVTPKYDDFRHFYNPEILILDNQLIVDLNSGKTSTTFGMYRCRVTINQNEYFLFTKKDESASILIDLKRQDTIQLKGKYLYLENLKLTNAKGITHQYIVATKTNGRMILLKNNRELSLAIPSSFKFNFDVIYYRNKQSKRIDLGFYLIKQGEYYFYNTAAELIRKKPAPKSGEFEFILKAGKEVYNQKNIQRGCFGCPMPAMEINREKDYRSFPIPRELANDYKLETEPTTGEIFLFHKQQKIRKMYRLSPHQKNPLRYLGHFVSFDQEGSNAFFIDELLTKPKHTMYPKKYFNQLIKINKE